MHAANVQMQFGGRINTYVGCDPWYPLPSAVLLAETAGDTLNTELTQKLTRRIPYVALSVVCARVAPIAYQMQDRLCPKYTRRCTGTLTDRCLGPLAQGNIDQSPEEQ